MLNKLLDFLFPPPLVIPQSKYAGVLIEIIPGEVGDDVGEDQCSAIGEACAGCPIDYTDVFEAADYPAESVKILSTGTPVYVPLQNKLLIVGKLVKPLDVVLSKEPILTPPTNYCPGCGKKMMEKHGQAYQEDHADEGPEAA